MNSYEKECFISIVCQRFNVKKDNLISLYGDSVENNSKWKVNDFSCVIELCKRHGKDITQDIVDRMYQTAVNEAIRGYYYID